MSGTLLEGFLVGHSTDERGRTGCTVVLPPPGNVTSVDIRGSSPGSRELALLDVHRRLTEVSAVLLTGGSAFGLAAADGVCAWLAERGVGYSTPVGPVPIVPAAVVFDLGEGDPRAHPGPEHGRAACDAAAETFATGRVGAGTGATVGKWAGRDHASPGGLGAARVAERGHEVAALAVVNAVGDVVDDRGEVIAGTRAPAPVPSPPGEPEIPTNTVLALVATRAALDKREVQWLAGRGSDGITVAVRPAHTRYDGDVTFAVAGPPAEKAPPADLDVLGVLATRAVAAAVRDAVRPAD